MEKFKNVDSFLQKKINFGGLRKASLKIDLIFREIVPLFRFETL